MEAFGLRFRVPRLHLSPVFRGPWETHFEPEVHVQDVQGTGLQKPHLSGTVGM